MVLRYKYAFPVLLCLLLAVAESAAAHGMRHGGVLAGEVSPEQRRKAELILAEARPRLHELRQQMRAKMVELQSFAYDNKTDPAVLPRLGRELQALRDSLRKELLELNDRLEKEVGVHLRIQRGRGCADLTQLPPSSVEAHPGVQPCLPAAETTQN